jgi:hypothetical protein
MRPPWRGFFSSRVTVSCVPTVEEHREEFEEAWHAFFSA